MRVTFTIPGPPGSKDRPRSAARIVGHGEDARAIATVYSDPAMERAEAEIARLWRVAARGHRTISGPVRLRIIAVFETPESWPRAVQRAAAEARVWHVGRPDLDNIEKLILDSLNKLAWADDGQVAVVEKGKRYGSPARVEVTVSTIDQQPDEITPGQRRLEQRVAVEGWDAVLAPGGRGRSSSKTGLPARMTVEELRQSGVKPRMPRSRR